MNTTYIQKHQNVFFQALFAYIVHFHLQFYPKAPISLVNNNSQQKVIA